MVVQTLVVGQLQTNCYLVLDVESREAMVIDPGAESERIFAAVQRLSPQPAAGVRPDPAIWVKYVVDTHAHFDHVRDNGPLLEALRAAQESPSKLVAHSAALPMLAQGGGAVWFGFRGQVSPEPDCVVGEGDVLQLGKLELHVLHTPGHSPGSISLYAPTEGAIFCGDLLFRQGVGRWDLSGGSRSTLLESIRSRVYTLPDATTVYPGHGPATTIGGERKSNPFTQ
jgi:glyoxylase-like metal-dependent hydrolase (beta-lactamase superfamily II)